MNRLKVGLFYSRQTRALIVCALPHPKYSSGSRILTSRRSPLPRSVCLAFAFAAGFAVQICPAQGEQPILPESQWSLLRSEASGTASYENLRALTRLHRVPATPEFNQAADF